MSSAANAGAVAKIADLFPEDEMALWPKEPIVTLPPAFEDDRGEIQPMCEIPMRSALMIYSRPGSVRGNHYHKTDWHMTYVISGKFEYYYRDANDTGAPKMMIVEAGQMLWTPPMVFHAMRYLEETATAIYSRNDRSQEEYERDVVRVNLI